MVDWPEPSRAFAPLFGLERSRLLEVLAALGASDWDRPTPCPGWSGQDLSARTATVTWASDGPVPVWLDQVRELSERWIHRQQLLQALGHASDLRPDLAGPVLDGLRWAYPHRLESVRRASGTTVAITVTGPEVHARWILVSDGETWQFLPVHDGELSGELQLTTEQAWRLLTNNFAPDLHDQLVGAGDHEIVGVLRRTRAIIGTPK